MTNFRKQGELTKISKPVSTEYELAGIIDALGEKPVFFENVKESSFPVVAGLVSSKRFNCAISRHKQKTNCCQNFPLPLSILLPPQLVRKASVKKLWKRR